MRFLRTRTPKRNFSLDRYRLSKSSQFSLSYTQERSMDWGNRSGYVILTSALNGDHLVIALTTHFGNDYLNWFPPFLNDFLTFIHQSNFKPDLHETGKKQHFESYFIWLGKENPSIWWSNKLYHDYLNNCWNSIKLAHIL